MAATHFSGDTIKIGFFEDFEKKKTFFGQKRMELLPARSQGLKKTIFIGFFEHPSKASSNIMQQQVTKSSTPPQKTCTFFLDNPFFDQKQLSKTLILHHPLKTVHRKISKKS